MMIDELVNELKKLRMENASLKAALADKERAGRLLDKEPFFEAGFHSIADAVIFADLRGRITCMNQAAEALWGYSLEELRGKSTKCLYAHKEDYENLGFSSLHVSNEIKNPVFELEFIRKNGERFFAQSQGVQILGEKGAVLGFIGIHRDITRSRVARERLRISEERYRNVYTTAPLAFVIWDRNGHITGWNRRAEEMFGWSRDEAEGKNFFEFLVPPEVRADMEGVVRDLLEKREPTTNISDNLTKSGEIIVCQWSNSILCDREGQIDGVLSLALDITERRKTEEALARSEAKFRLAFENATDAIFWADPTSGLITNCNKAAERLLEKKKEEIVGCHQRTLHPPHLADYYEDLFISHYSMKTTADTEAEVITATGRLVPVRITAAITMIGEEPIMQGIFRDISERKQAERAVKESSERIKYFAYSISHDLKNPAEAMNGIVRRFYSRYRDKFDPKGISYCEQILKTSEHIAALVQDINTYIQTKQRPLDIESIDLHDVFRSLQEEFAVPLTIRGIRLVLPDLVPLIRADRVALIRALQNLIDNALKYGGQNLTKIEVGYGQTMEYHIISVRDDGGGLSPEGAKNIFDVFQRSANARKIEGTGLGLAIVKEIAEHHGGMVWADPDLERGIAFQLAISKEL